MERKACWWMPWSGVNNGKWCDGYFLGWGLEQGEVGSYSVGIIEDFDTGDIYTVAPSRIRFAIPK